MISYVGLKSLRPLEIKEVEEIYALANKDNMFTCSAIQYAKEFSLDKQTKDRIGDIKQSDIIISGPWDRYSIHIIEPILRTIGHDRQIKNSKTMKSINQTTLWIEWADGTTSSFTTTKAKVPIQMRILGDKGYEIREFKDTFNAFKSALQHFIGCVKNQEKVPDKQFVLKAVELIERGL